MLKSMIYIVCLSSCSPNNEQRGVPDECVFALSEPYIIACAWKIEMVIPNELKHLFPNLTDTVYSQE
jgi:hypothetical protein